LSERACRAGLNDCNDVDGIGIGTDRTIIDLMSDENGQLFDMILVYEALGWNCDESGWMFEMNLIMKAFTWICWIHIDRHI
jgi:hypothetical protein